MARTRTNWILAGVLLVQVALIGYLYRPQPQEAPRSHAFLPEVTMEMVQEVTLTNEAGRRLRLTRSGQEWLISNLDGLEQKDSEKEQEPGPQGRDLLPLPADREKVADFLRKVTGLESDRLVARTKSSQARLQVGPETFQRRIELRLADDTTRAILLGTSPSFKTIHVRAAAEQSTYLVRDLAAWEAAIDLASWWQSDYLEVDPADLTSLQVENRHGTLILQREEGGAWEPGGGLQGGNLDQEALEAFLSQLSFLTLLEYMSREEPPVRLSGAPEATLVLQGAEQEIILEIWPPTGEEEERLVKASISPFWVTAAEYELQPILELSPEDLLVGADEQGGDGGREPSGLPAAE